MGEPGNLMVKIRPLPIAATKWENLTKIAITLGNMRENIIK